MESLTRLNELYKDLVDFSESRLANVDRLWLELNDSLEDLRGLLDKKSKNDASRKQLESGKDDAFICQEKNADHPIGKLKLDEEEYEVNSDFKQIALELADSLQLDELDAAKLVLECQEDTDGSPPSVVLASASRFHERREVLLQDMRMVLKESIENDSEDGFGVKMQEVVAEILETKTGPPSNGSLYARKCISALDDVERSLANLAEQVNKAKVLGEEQARFLLEFIDVQRVSLVRQHEALGSILCYLFRANHTTSEDLRKLVDLAKKRDRFDPITLHYLPSLSAGITQYGSSEGSGGLRDARSLHKLFCPSSESQQGHWSLHPLQSAIVLMWIAEYSGWYREPGRVSPGDATDSAKDSEERTKIMSKALEDGALEFLLAVCGAIRPEERLDAARQEILTLLLSNVSGLTFEGDTPAEYFHLLLMESFETFAEAWITNMPDDIRRLKIEEDEQRLHKLTEAHEAGAHESHADLLDARMYLEALLVLMSFAYEERPEAADHFWGDPDGNLYGFLQWASRRQTVPRASAFCELICALACGNEPAASAHKFLQEESMTSTRSRKSPSLNYGQIMAELQLYSTKVHERSSPTRPLNDLRATHIPELNELESPVMLSCYLRLIAHMCTESQTARSFFLDTKDFDFVRTGLLLSSGPVPSYLRATVFKAIQALLTDKTSAINNEIWTAIDFWASGALSSSFNSTKTTQPQQSPKVTIRQTLDALAVNFDQANAFVALAQALIALPKDTPGSSTLTFPEDLGSNYRMPGVEPYVDFIIGQLFAKRALELPEENQIRSLQYNCLNFVATCLETFNEKLLIITQSTSGNANSSVKSSVMSDYVHRHPCARVMDWMFNSEVIKGLLQAMKQEFNMLESATSMSLVVLLLERSIDVVNIILELQPSYFDILRPATKQTATQNPSVANSAIAAFEDVVASQSELLSDLALYASSSHETLVLRSFALIQALARSRRLKTGRRGSSRSAFDLLKASPYVREASLALVPKLRIDVRELEHGPLTSEYRFKSAILSFLNNCLSAAPSDRNVAHILLGFESVPGSFDLILSDDETIMVLHAIIGLADNYPDGEGESLVSWFVHIKALALEVLRRLWTCGPSSMMTITELRNARFLSTEFSKQPIVNLQTLWDGKPMFEPFFWLSDSASAVNEFLRYRSFLYEYAVTELRAIVHSGLPTLQMHTFSTLMGKSKFDHELIEHPNVFELFDFANLEFGPDLVGPDLNFLADIDLASCQLDSTDVNESIYDLESVEELIQLRVTQLQQEGKFRPGLDDEQFANEVEALLAFLKAQNQRNVAQASFAKTLHLWTEMLIVTLECCPMSENEKVQYHLQAFQTVLPKLDTYLLNAPAQALDLAIMIDTLTASFNALEQSIKVQRIGTSINDRLYQIFRIILQGIHGPSSGIELREVCYNICTRYVDRILSLEALSPKALSHTIDAVRSAGTRLITVICDDADSGDGSCRLSALVALNSLVCLGRLEKTTYIIDTLVYFNFLEVLIDPIKSVALDLQEAEGSGE